MFLRSCALPSKRNCFVLGSFDYKKTVRTQMDRAAVLSLGINQRCTEDANKRVAIVGGGFAGLMAASVLLKLGFNVTLFERNRLLLPLQIRCYDRYIHPSSYEWPLAELDNTYKLAGVYWSAGFADQVCGQVLSSFEKIRSKQSNMYSEYLSTHIDGIHTVNENAIEKYEITDSKRYTHGLYDYVILAVGFGTETHVTFGDKVSGYWEGSGLININGTQDRPVRLLVSGSGDGSLISIIEAMFKESDHAKLIEMVSSWMPDELMISVKDNEAQISERHRQGEPIDILRSYDELFTTHMPSLRPNVDACVEPGAIVTLNTSNRGIFTVGSSPINRILTYLLFRAEFISFRSGKMEESMVEEEIGADGARRYSVTWPDGDVRNYDRIITRYGVNSNYVLTSVRELDRTVMDTLSRYRSLEFERSIPEDIMKYLK
ncbi:MAG: FAD-dependent oxidoreductase [Devosia sp.]